MPTRRARLRALVVLGPRAGLQDRAELGDDPLPDPVAGLLGGGLRSDLGRATAAASFPTCHPIAAVPIPATPTINASPTVHLSLIRNMCVLLGTGSPMGHFPSSLNSLKVTENGSLLVLIATTPTFTRSGNCDSIGSRGSHSLPSSLTLARIWFPLRARRR